MLPRSSPTMIFLTVRSCALTMQFNSVERVIEYTALPVEGGKPDDRGSGSSGTVAKQV